MSSVAIPSNQVVVMSRMDFADVMAFRFKLDSLAILSTAGEIINNFMNSAVLCLTDGDYNLQ